MHNRTNDLDFLGPELKRVDAEYRVSVSVVLKRALRGALDARAPDAAAELHVLSVSLATGLIDDDPLPASYVDGYERASRDAVALIFNLMSSNGESDAGLRPE